MRQNEIIDAEEYQKETQRPIIRDRMAAKRHQSAIIEAD